MAKLTQDEIERYAPYHTMTAFEIGFADYERGQMQHEPFDIGHGGVDSQAYDRGAECAMRRRMKQQRSDLARTEAEINRIAFKSAGATRKR